MTTRFESKDPAEEFVVGFDYSKIGNPSTPAVTVAVRSGEDANANSVLSGAPTVSGTWVYQRVVGGVSGVDYSLRCLATVNGMRLLIDAILPVRARPTAD